MIFRHFRSGEQNRLPQFDQTPRERTRLFPAHTNHRKRNRYVDPIPFEFRKNLTYRPIAAHSNEARDQLLASPLPGRTHYRGRSHPNPFGKRRDSKIHCQRIRNGPGYRILTRRSGKATNPQFHRLAHFRSDSHCCPATDGHRYGFGLRRRSECQLSR